MSKILSVLSGITVIVLLMVLGGALISLADSSGQLDWGARAGLGTTFTYQGHLTDGPNPASGRYDFTFALYDDPEAGSQVGPAVSEVISVTQGLFAVELDFGSVFDGTALWLEIGVRPDGETEPHTALLPRQRLTAAPLATYAGSAPWSGLSGVPAGFADGIDDDTQYQAGTGLDLVDTTLGITLTYQLPQGCDPNQFIRWTGAGWACTEAGTGITGWALSGNSGTTPGVDFLGTTDDAALQLHVNGSRAFRLEPDATSPNILGGYGGNSADTGVAGATIGGGGRDLATNRVSASYGTVSGGAGNSAAGYGATVAGGEGNSAGGNYATAGGGSGNLADGARSTIGGGSNNAAGWDYATVSGGSGNVADAPLTVVGGGAGNIVSDTYGTVAGGLQNQAGGNASAVGGGHYNTVSAAYGTIAGGGPFDLQNPATTNNRVFDEYGAIGGGGANIAGFDDGNTTAQSYATVAGGLANTASASYATAAGGNGNTATGYASSVGGGAGNTAGDNYATVGGGSGNSASGQYGTVAGGQLNTAGSRSAAVGGGQGNSVTGAFGTIPGGAQNAVTGNYGLAAGLQARAEHQGTFVWSDSSPDPFASTGPDQFLISAAGGVGIGTNTPSHLLTVEGSAAIQSSDLISVSVIYGDAKILQAPRSLYAVGDLLYVGSYATNTLSIWNVTDPPNHTLIGYTTFQLQGPMDLQVVGDRAYVASQNRDMLTILDVSDPADPSHVGDTTEYLDYPQGVHVSGKYTYVASMGNGGRYDGLTIFDVTDAPAEIAATSFITTYLQGTSDVFVVDRYAYVTSRGNNRLVVFDVSDPRNPLPVSYTEAALNQPVRVYVSGTYAYVVAEGADAVVVFDVSNPAQLVYLDQITTGLARPRSIYVSGDRAYVAYPGADGTSANCGLAVLDVSDPAQLAVLNVIDMSNWLDPDLAPPKPVAVTGSGDRIYVANERHDSVTIFAIDGLEASAVRTGELQAAHLEVADYAAIEGDLGVRGGLNVGPGGALVQGTLSVEGPGNSYIQGRLGIGPVATVITRSISPTESEEIILRQPTHQLDVDGEARFRVNERNHLVFRSNNAGSDEDAYIDFVDFAYPDLITPSARIQFDATDPFTRTTSMRFFTQGADDTQMQSRLEIRSNGDVRPGADGAYLLGTPDSRWDTVYSVNGVQTGSDGRFKENVSALPYGLDEVTALRPVTFSWIEHPDDGLHYGLIAQEVREVLPDIVKGDDGETGMIGMNYSELVPVLVRAVQEQQAEIETQAEQIAGLEARLEALEEAQSGKANQPGTLNLLATFGFGGLVLGAVSIAGARRIGGRS